MELHGDGIDMLVYRDILYQIRWFTDLGLHNFPTYLIREVQINFVQTPNCFGNKRPSSLIAPPSTIGFLTTENLPKVKLGQVKVGSNITQNHSSRL